MRIIKEKTLVNPEKNVNIFSLFVNSFAYVGFIPFASGTFGSLAALLLFVIPGFDNIFILASVTVILFLISLFSGKHLLERYGDDPSVFVIDEVIGFLITIIIIKIIHSTQVTFSVYQLVIAFFSFRFFDIIKLQPAVYFDKVKSVFGVLMDDIISGIYAGLFASLIIFVIKYL